MAGILPGDPSHHGMVESSPYRISHDMMEEGDHTGSSWYLSRKEIEENSPSRRDGIDLKKEAYYRKSYCTFLQDLGMRLKVPQVTIATAIVFCHRFFLRQSHLKNDRREVYEEQKERILLGERVVLATLGFDLNVHHPYKPLVEAIKKFKVAQNALAQVAWNFVNDGLRTSLCLQFKPHHTAAGAIFLAAKFLKVKLPSDGDKVWWQEFDVTPRQLEEVSNQMLELYEQNRNQAPSHGNETEGSSASAANRRAPPRASTATEAPSQNGPHQAAVTSLHHDIQASSSRPAPNQVHAEKQNGPQRFAQSERNDHEVKDSRYGKMESGSKDRLHHEPGNVAEGLTNKSAHDSERAIEEPGEISRSRDRSSGHSDGPKSYSPLDAIKKIDKDKVKAALEKRRKERSEVSKKPDVMDDDDLIERELESGIELAAEDERVRQESRRGWSKPLCRHEPQNQDHGIENGELRTEKEMENAEEGEFHSPEPASRKRKDGYDHPYQHHPPPLKHRDADDLRAMGRLERAERDHKRIRQENHV